jgi:hypothetical protein
MTITPEVAREQYIAGLRALADALDADETLPLPISEIAWPVWGYEGDEAAAATLAKIARLMDGPVRKKYDDDFFLLFGTIRGLPIRPWAMRDMVCRKVVKGTKEITENIPTGFETITKTVEDVEWVCEPLLAAEAAS